MTSHCTAIKHHTTKTTVICRCEGSKAGAPDKVFADRNKERFCGAKSATHRRSAFCRALFPSSRVLPRACPFSSISVLPCTLYVVSHFALRFAHPLWFAFPFSVLLSALPIIDRFATGFVFRVIVNDTHREKLQDFYMKCMDRSGFIIVNDTHLDMHDVFVSIV